MINQKSGYHQTLTQISVSICTVFAEITFCGPKCQIDGQTDGLINQPSLGRTASEARKGNWNERMRERHTAGVILQ